MAMTKTSPTRHSFPITGGGGRAVAASAAAAAAASSSWPVPDRAPKKHQQQLQKPPQQQNEQPPPSQPHSEGATLSLGTLLSYSEMSVGRNGAVMGRPEKAALRDRHGYCKDCVGQPVLLYDVRKSRMNPLWVTREARDVPGVCGGGVCFVCHPARDPHRRERRLLRQSHKHHLVQHHHQQRRRTVSGTVSLQPQQQQQQQSRNPAPDVGEERRLADVAAAPDNLPSPASSPSKTGGAPHAAAVVATTTTTPSATVDVPATAPAATAGCDRVAATGAATAAVAATSSSPPLDPACPRRDSTQCQKKTQQVRRRPSLRNLFRSEGVTTTATTATATAAAAASEGGCPPTSFLSQPQASGDERDEKEGNGAGGLTGGGTPRNESDGGFGAAAEAAEEEEAAAASSSPRPELPPPIEYTVQQQRDDQEPVAFGTPAPSPETEGGETTTTKIPAAVGAGPNTSGDEEGGEIHIIMNQMDSLVEDMQSFASAAADDGGLAASAQFVAEIVLGTMREHEAVEAIQAHCLKTVRDLCKGHDEGGDGGSGSGSGSCLSLGGGNRDLEHHREAIMRAGGGEFVVLAMARFPDSAVIQERGCGAVWALCVNASNRVELTRAGACLAVYKALSDFATSEGPVRAAVGAMRALSPELEAREALKTLNTSRAAVRAMGMHARCVPVQRDACALLSNLAVDIERQQVAAVPAEEMEAVVRAIANHRRAASVLQGACFALKNYLHEEKNCRTLRHHCKDAVPLLVHVSVSPLASATCRADAADLLERLELSRTMDESMEEQAVDRFRREMEDLRRASPGSDAPDATTQKKRVKAALEFVGTHHDWSPRLVAEGLMTLRQLLTGTEERDVLFEDGAAGGGGTALAAVADYCRRWKKSDSVCLEACGLVSVVALDPHRHAEILNLGWLEFIFEALELFSGDGKLVGSALGALKTLAQNSDRGMDLVKSELPTLVDAISLHEGNEAVQMYGVELLSLAFQGYAID